MYLALIKKELREILPIAVVAGVAFAIAVGNVIGSELANQLPFVDYALSISADRDVPFAGYFFLHHLSSITFYFATALGLRQTLGEEYRGTYLLLLHRPVPRRSIVAVKGLVGLVLYLAVASIAIVSLGWWAGTPGNQPAPFYWSMTIPSWQMLSMMTLVYLGAFLAGVREASWFGTRLVPWYAAVAFTKLVSLDTLIGLVMFAIAVLVLSTGIVWVTSNKDYA